MINQLTRAMRSGEITKPIFLVAIVDLIICFCLLARISLTFQKRHITMTPDNDRRDFDRVPITLFGIVALEAEVGVICTTNDLSLRGAMLETACLGRIGKRAALTLLEIGKIDCRVVRVSKSGFAVEFDRGLASSATLAIIRLLMNRDAVAKYATSRSRRSAYTAWR